MDHNAVLINNGGISQRSLVAETRLSVDRKIMEVNYFGNIALTKGILASMIANKSGHIVNISSLVGKFGTPYRSAYAASKHALHGFYDSMRAELWNKNIEVTMVCPGFVKTNVSINALDKDGNKTEEMDDAQANGMLPETAANKIVWAIKKSKKELYLGGKEVYAVYLKRFFPSLFSKMIKKAKVR
jgi:short-subunit dehydrogenase